MQFPIQTGNETSVSDALNYLLSGPGGLGQDFQGYQQWTTGWMTGNFRTPYTVLSYNAVCVGVAGEYTIVAAVNFNTNVLTTGMVVTGYGVAPGAVIVNIGMPTTEGTTITLDLPNDYDIDNDLTFSPANPPVLYVAPIACTSAVRLDPYTFQYNFAATQPYPPFSPGNNIYGAGWTDDFYNGRWPRIGVSSCTVDHVVVKLSNPYPDQPDDFGGGTIEYFVITTAPEVNALSTDCNSKITVTGGTDRVFISSQLINTIAYDAVTSTDLNYAVAINRYKGFPNSDPANPGYLFDFDKTIAKKIYQYSGLSGTGTLPEVETIFSNFPDSDIVPGYYWYIMDVTFQITNGGDCQVTQNTLGLRSMSTQVVKQ
jgi:hypothetical protein